MINSKKELEDYICEHQKEFINKIKETFNIKEDLKFVGKEINVTENDIADLVYYYTIRWPEQNIEIKNYIIVELKFGTLELKNLINLTRNMNILGDKIFNESKNETTIKGILVGFDLDNNMQEIQTFLNYYIEKYDEDKIGFITIDNNINFNIPLCKYKDEYIQNFKLDSRIGKDIV